MSNHNRHEDGGGRSAGATSFAQMFGLESRDNPSSRSVKSGRGKRGRETPTGGAVSAARKAAAKKPAAKKPAAKKPCKAPRRCKPEVRYELRKAGKWTGLWDHGAGTPSGRRGRFVKRGDHECGSEKGQSAEFMLDVMRDSERPEAQKFRRGPYEVWLDRSQTWFVYHVGSATLLEQTFRRKGDATGFIARGAAAKHACPTTSKASRASKQRGMARRDNPGHDDGYAHGEVVNLGGRGTIEQRVSSLESQSAQHETRLTRVEGGLGRALNLLSGRKPHQLGA